MGTLRQVGVVCSAIVICSNAVAGASFVPLGRLAGYDYSGAQGVSDDGTVVVGFSGMAPEGTAAFRWTSEGGMVDLGTYAGAFYNKNANDVSGDGSVVVGLSSDAELETEAFRWASEDGMAGLGDLGGGVYSESSACGVSVDGSVVVGSSISDSGNEAFRWTSEGGMAGLGDITGGHFESRASGVSADGSVVVGRGYSTLGREAFRWTSEGGMAGLGDLAGGEFYSEANRISADGSVIIGRSKSALGYEAFRWTSEGGMVGLGHFAGGAFYSEARGVSADGSVIVGTSNSASGNEAFRWTALDGMQSVASILTVAGVNLTGWALEHATDISADGNTIVGYGLNPDGFTEAWLADLGTDPRPVTPVDLSGTIRTDNDTDICAIVLASGRYMFSCDPVGVFSLSNLPREKNGTVKRQIYADGFLPEVDILTDSTDEAVVMTRSGNCPGYNMPYGPGFFPDSAGTWIDISGTVYLQDTRTPVCAMVLANGQHMFSCDGTGSYALNIPLDSNGQFKLQVYADGFAPTTRKFDEFSVNNDVRMARAVECQ